MSQLGFPACCSPRVAIAAGVYSSFMGRVMNQVGQPKFFTLEDFMPESWNSIAVHEIWALQSVLGYLLDVAEWVLVNRHSGI